MKVAVVSDIHGNRHAFEATLEAIADSSAAELWCLGDLVGYGAEPDACVALARAHAAVCLAGNHDLAVTGDIPLENLAFLRSLTPQGEEGEVGLYHASPRDPVWEYVVSSLLAELCLDAQQQRISLIGHSHVALSFVRREGDLTTGEPQRDGAEIDLADGEWLLNPGSVGQPRDGDPRAGWLLLDIDGLTASYHRAAYDVAGAAAAIRAARLPDSLAERLSYGQ
jgi:predicted phosphodiesterase